jgi:hypothetical protein
MPNAAPAIPRNILVALTMLSLLSACTVGPFDISFRGSASSNSAGQQQSDLASTVTAVFATNTQVAVLRTATALSQAAAPSLVQATLPPAPIQPSTPASDLRLTYDENTFTLYNISLTVQDIAGLSFHSDRGELNSAQWDNGFLSASLSTFPAGDCLMAWGINTEGQAKPADCRTRHAWIAVRNQETFWRTDTIFSVRCYGQNIAECQAVAGVCLVNLP